VETEVSNTPVESAPTSPEAAASPAPAPTESPPVAASPADDSAPSPSSEADQSPSAEGGEGATSGIVDESAVTWNGEIDALSEAEWFNSIDEKHRNVLLEGMQAKYKNLEGGFTKKTQEMAEFRKESAAKEAKLASEVARYERWLGSGDDLTAQAVKEADDLRAKLESATATRTEAEEALRAQLAEEMIQKLTPVEQERDKLRQELETIKEAAYEQEVQRNNEVMQGLVRWVDEHAPDLWDDGNEDALTAFTTQLETGASSDPKMALKVVGALFPKFNPSAPEELPPALAAMNTDSSTAFELPGTAPQAKSYDELKAELESQLRRAQRG